MEKREPSYTVGGNVNWYSHYGEQYGGSLKILKIELPYDPAIPLLGIYIEKTKLQKDTYTPMFIAAIYNSQDMETTLMSIDRGMGKEDVVHIYTMEYYPAIKKNEIMPFPGTWMDLEIVILSEVSQTEKEKYRMISLICGI